MFVCMFMSLFVCVLCYFVVVIFFIYFFRSAVLCFSCFWVSAAFVLYSVTACFMIFVCFLLYVCDILDRFYSVWLFFNGLCCIWFELVVLVVCLFGFVCVLVLGCVSCVVFFWECCVFWFFFFFFIILRPPWTSLLSL